MHLNRHILRDHVIPSLTLCLKQGLPIPLKEQRIIHQLTEIAARLSPNNDVTVGTVIETVLYATSRQLPTHRTQTSTLHALKKSLNALFQKVGLGVVCHIDRTKSLGNERPLYFESYEADDAAIQLIQPSQQRPLRREEIIMAFYSAFKQLNPPSNKGTNALIQTALAVAASVDREGLTTCGAVYKKLYPRKRPVAEQIEHRQKRINAFFQQAGMDISITIDRHYNANMRRPLCFIGTPPTGSLPKIHAPRRLSKRFPTYRRLLAAQIYRRVAA